MTERRLPNTRPTPRLERGDEPPRPACDGNPEPYDTLIDISSGPVYRYALHEAREICNTCPIRGNCLTENRDEDWAKAILGVYPLTPTTQPNCGTKSGADGHYKRREKPCEPCRLAANAHKRGEPNRRIAKCGTDSGYYRHKRTLKDEPCDECLKAHAAVVQERSRRRVA